VTARWALGFRGGGRVPWALPRAVGFGPVGAERCEERGEDGGGDLESGSSGKAIHGEREGYGVRSGMCCEGARGEERRRRRWLRVKRFGCICTIKRPGTACAKEWHILERALIPLGPRDARGVDWDGGLWSDSTGR
jgi:hypothetical protein